MQNRPPSSDLEQVVAYAEAKGCKNAALIYPASLSSPVRGMWGNIYVEFLTFPLDGDLERDRLQLLEQRLSRIVKSHDTGDLWFCRAASLSD